VPEQTRAQQRIEYTQRKVYISARSGGAGGPLARPIGKRIGNTADPALTEVAWFDSRTWNPPAQRRQFLEELSDLVLLLDDDMVEALRDARPDAPEDASVGGLELPVVLATNEVRRVAGLGEPVRLWLAKAEALPRLVGLRRVAQRPEWNIEQLDADGALHWLYSPEERVLEHDPRDDGRLSVDDDKRLGRNVEQFVDHQPAACPHCGRTHA
jgi:hypothetical protein